MGAEVIAKIDRWTDRKRVFLLLRSLDRELDFFQLTQKGGGGAVQFHAPILHFVFWEASAQQLSRGRSPPTRVLPERGVCVCVHFLSASIFYFFSRARLNSFRSPPKRASERARGALVEKKGQRFEFGETEM